MTATGAEALKAYESLSVGYQTRYDGLSPEEATLARHKDELIFPAFMAMTDCKSALRKCFHEAAAERHVLLHCNPYTARFPVGIDGEFQAFKDFLSALGDWQHGLVDYKPDVPYVRNDPYHDVPRQPLPDQLAWLERSLGWR